MSFDKNIYYNPEKFGLIVVAEAEYSSGSYEFDTRVVWKNTETGALYTVRDSGCSCPVPFEDYDLTNIDKYDYKEIKREIEEELKRSEEFNYTYFTFDDAQNFYAKLRNL